MKKYLVIYNFDGMVKCKANNIDELLIHLRKYVGGISITDEHFARLLSVSKNYDEKIRVTETYSSVEINEILTYEDIYPKEKSEVGKYNENCVICNCEIDEAEAGGIWDLAAKICEELNIDSGELINEYESNQDCIYSCIRSYLEKQNYCPKCGAKMNEVEE